VQIAVGSEGLWQRFCPASDLEPEMSGFATNPERVAHHDKLVDVIEAVFAHWRAADLLARLDEVGVPAGRVRTIDEVYAWEQTRSQGLLIEVAHETLGGVRLAGPPLRFFDRDGREVTRTVHAAPPTLDGDGASVRAWLAGSERR
jgi:crotonobetainyl-CoA:carnitine CoA-transferase CaiB-like acyl-CoA transferase